jgi:hypothetical protein
MSEDQTICGWDASKGYFIQVRAHILKGIFSGIVPTEADFRAVIFSYGGPLPSKLVSYTIESRGQSVRFYYRTAPVEISSGVLPEGDEKRNPSSETQGRST